jgi:hypothetical protein
MSIQSSRNLLNLILLIIILGLIAVVVYEPGKEKPLTPPKLTALNDADIQHIKISRQTDANDIELSKTTEGWVMLKPYQLTANSFRVESILKLLSTVSFSQNSLDKLDLKNFGLDKPYATVTLNNSTSIIFGHNKSLKHLRYVQIGTVLHMISDSFYYQLAAKAESFIDHQLLPKNSKIIKLILPELKLQFAEDKWSVTPEPAHFSMDAVNELINEWNLSQAYDIGYTKNKMQNTDKLKADITVFLSEDMKIRFNILKSNDDFSLLNIDTGVKYMLAKDRKDKLLKLPEPELSDKQ